MSDVVDRLWCMRRQLCSRVRDALDDADPELAESAVGRMNQADVLVQLASKLLADEVGPKLASEMVCDLARRGVHVG